MYHSGSAEATKEFVLKSLLEMDVVCRVVFATNALVMGVNMRVFYGVIHCGPPYTIEEYQQEYGRAGRDGKESETIILWNRVLLQYASLDIRKYLRNSDLCRRHQVMQLFGAKPCHTPLPHSCCDICAKTCTCKEDTSCSYQDMKGSSCCEC